MNTTMKFGNRSKRGQGMVEFALVFPVLLLIIFGIIEFSRLMFTYIAITSASREGARYASAIGGGTGGVPRYRDCEGIRAATRRVGILAAITDTDIVITYDHGPGTGGFEDCPIGWTPQDPFAAINLGDRVMVEVTGHFLPIVPVIPNGINFSDITARSMRSIVRDVAVGAAYQPVPPPPPPGPRVSFLIEDSEANETDSEHPHAIFLKLSEAGSGPIQVSFMLSGGSATPGLDYSVSTYSVEFAAGATHASFNAAILPDDIYEGAESFQLQITGVSGPNASIDLAGPLSHTVTILDNDDEPKVQFNVASANVTEDSDIAPGISLRLNRPSSMPVVVDLLDSALLGGTAALGLDYEVITASPVTFDPGVTTYPFYVRVFTDTIYEAIETARFQIGSVSTGAQIGTPNTFQLSILNTTGPPTVTFELDSQSGTETLGLKPVKLLLSRMSSEPVTVNFQAGGTAERGIDYNLFPDANPAGTLTIPAMTNSAFINIQVLNDLVTTEEDETIILTLTGAAPADIAEPDTHTATIVDRTVRFEVAIQNTTEESGASLRVNAVLSSPSIFEVRVPFTLGGTAISGQDYQIFDFSMETATTGVLVFPVGATTTNLDLRILDDILFEGGMTPETIVFTMGEPQNAALGAPYIHTINITEAETAPTVRFTTSSQSQQENLGNMTIQVQLSGPSGVPVTVEYGLSGTARLGSSEMDDYTITPSPVVIPAGSTSAQILITVRDDEMDEDDETVTVTMGFTSFAVKGTPSVHTATILDDDTPPSVSFNLEGQSVSEFAGQATAGLRLSKPSGRVVRVDYVLDGSSANLGTDFTIEPASTIYFAPGQVSANILVNVLEDDLPEAEENVVLSLTTLTGATPGATMVHTVHITDNDRDRCNAVYTFQDITGEKIKSGNTVVGYKINTSIVNGGTENVTLIGFSSSYSYDISVGTPQILLNKFTTTNLIWPSGTQTALSDQWVSENWTVTGNRTLAVGTNLPLTLEFRMSGVGEILKFNFNKLTIGMSNTCIVSAQKLIQISGK